jgi:hypothetical protein
MSKKLVWVTNDSEEKMYKFNQEQLAKGKFVKGIPIPPDNSKYTVEDLEAMGLIGLYRYEEEIENKE